MRSAGQRRHFLSRSGILIAAGLLPLREVSALKTPETRATLILELDLSTRTRDVGRAIQAGVRAALQSSSPSLPVLVIDTHGNTARALDALTDYLSTAPIAAIIGGGDGLSLIHI